MRPNITPSSQLIFQLIKTALVPKPKLSPLLRRGEFNRGENRLAYLSGGPNKKPALVFLPGWGQSKESWAGVLTVLAKSFPVYALDLPGFGKSALSQSLTNPNNYAALLKSFLEKEGVESAVLTGHSFGGKIAVLFTNLYPKRVIDLHS